MTELHPRQEYVRPELGEARVERQWAAIERRLPGPAGARAWRWSLPALGIAALAAGASTFVYLRTGPTLAAGALLESAHAEVAVQLEDGSRVTLAPKSELRLVDNRPKTVALELRSGRARFAVKHDPARRFAIQMGPAEVRVIGTHFELGRSEGAGARVLEVAVTEGVVEVHRRDRPGEPAQRIHAGERWSARLGAEPATSTAQAEAAKAPAHDEAEEGTDEPIDEPTEQAAGNGRAARTPPVETPSTLFSQASLARRAGRMQDAADGYAALLARHPSDTRAGLSAFELGRIRMDALADPRGAIAALEQALRSGATSSFHEDALARIVIAQDALGRADACRDARTRYLAAYPSGVHAQALRNSCDRGGHAPSLPDRPSR